jgi:hypothetical protein
MRVDAMMAGVAVVESTQAPSTSSRHTVRDHDALDGLEHVGSGPRVSPAEPAGMLGPEGREP